MSAPVGGSIQSLNLPPDQNSLTLPGQEDIVAHLSQEAGLNTAHEVKAGREPSLLALFQKVSPTEVQADGGK